MGKRYGASFETLREDIEAIRPAESIRRPPRLEAARTAKGSQSGRQVMTGRSLTLTEAGNDLDNFAILQLRRARGQLSTLANIASGDRVGRVDFLGYDSTITASPFVSIARIEAAVSGSAGSFRGELRFSTSNTSETLVEGMRITQVAGQPVLRVGDALGTDNSNSLVEFHLQDTNNSSVVAALALVHDVTNTPAAGIGVRLEFVLEDSSAPAHAASIDAVLTNAGASEESDFVFNLSQSGSAPSEFVRFVGTTGGIHIGTGATNPPTGGLRAEGGIYIETGGLTVAGGASTFTDGISGDLVLTDDSTALIRLDTSDGSDSSRLILAGGGGSSTTRGASIAIAGNEFGGGEEGTINIFGGLDSADGGIKLWTDSALRFDINFAGLTTITNLALTAGLSLGGDLVLTDDTTALIRLDTSNGSDSSRLVLAGGGDIGTTRGGYIAIAGNEFGGGEEGTINIFGGTDSADGGLKLWTDDTLRLSINFAGLTTLSAGLTVTGGNITGTIATTTQNSITTMTGLVTVGALNSGSITSGFGNIDNGSSTLDTGVLTAATAQVDDGTDSSPSIFFTDQAGTGLFRPASNTIGIGLATAERIRFGASWIHVGTTFTTPPAGGIRTEGQIIVEASGIDMTGDLILRSFSTTAVSEGVTDSGGSGFKLLRVPN